MSKTWFITGTSSGIGRVLTEQLLERGHRVAATLRRMDALDDLKARHGDRLWIAPLEMTDRKAVREIVDRAFAELGEIDVIVSNAGYGLFGAAEEVAEDDIPHQIDTNLTGSIDLVRASLPYLRAQGHGHIMQVASEGGQVTYPNFSLYHATKWGIEGFCETVAKEIAPFGLKVTIVEPGATRTEFGASLKRAPVIEAYEQSVVGDVRRAIENGAFAINGDPSKMAAAMIDIAESENPPLRLALGGNTYAGIRAALEARLAELEAYKHVTLAMDFLD